MLCQRLNVQPKQFAALLALLVFGVGGLALKSAFGPRAASATASAERAKPATSSIENNAATFSANIAANGEVTLPRTVVQMVFDTTPARDPFKPWGVTASPPETALALARISTDAIPGVLPGLALKAVMQRELAVFGDQTVRAGDALTLPDGSFARVQNIFDRSVLVEFNGRIIDVHFGAATKTPAAGGFQ